MTESNFDPLLIGLLKAYSPSHEERAASEYLAGWMQSAGYDRAFVDESGNAVGVLGEGPKEIVLLGHIDTVPGYINVEVRDGLLYGRGSVDAKGPLATFVAAAIHATRLAYRRRRRSGRRGCQFKRRALRGHAVSPGVMRHR